MKSKFVAWPNWLGRRAVAAIVLAGVSIGAAEAQTTSADPLNLSGALSLALENNPITGAARAEIRAAEADALQAGLWDNPTLGAEIEEFGSDRGGLGDADTTLSINQTIPLGGDRGRAREAANAWASAASAELALQRNRLLASTAQAYVAAQAASETLSLRMELLEIANNSADAIRSRVEAGRASPIERNRADMLVGLATIAANDAASAQSAANNQLVAIWSGGPVNGELAPPLQAFDLTAYSDAQPVNWISDNPELLQLRAITRARSQEIRRERAAAIPDLTVGAGVRRFGGTDETAFVATLEVPIPVLNRNQGGVAAAASRENAARLNEEVMRRSLIAQYASSAGRFARAQSTYTQLNENILPASENALGAAQGAYREGALDILNFLDIQRSYFDVRVDLITARAELARAAIELDVLAGAPQLNRLVETNSEEAVQ
ncbi:TolC family protein [Maricaulis maris]|uniref:TolC family protein n=1 Tax=Maricaulis maris TaxID=74318 RepID=UPI0011090366